ncbi:MAG: T9SS type A sorting domain-containing protein, partial [Candidatus Eisenbacteria bacterium]|nr:T9SS type A sorting domain-containing protein [Candidatus Eisenbacteria bacterium]
PNPVRQHTTLQISWETAEPIEILIHDATGRRVRHLIAGPGAAEVVWDARSDDGRRVGAGSYFYRMRSGDHRAAGSLRVLQ